MSKHFKFELIADELTRMLLKDNDEITACGISESYIVIGTLTGHVHTLFLDSNEGMVIGPFSVIKSIACLGDTFAYVAGSRVAVFNPKTQRELFNTSIPEVRLISICSNSPKLYSLVCTTKNSLKTIKKGWTSPNTEDLHYNVLEPSELIAHGNIACVVDKDKMIVVSLREKKILYEVGITKGSGRFHWISPTLLISAHGLVLEILQFDQSNNTDDLFLIETMDLEYVPISLTSFNQSNIVLLGPSLVIFNSVKNVIFNEKPPINGKLLSNNKANSPFFLVGSSQIFKVELPNVKGKIRILVHEFKFSKAYELCERFKLNSNEVLYPHIEHLLKLKQFEEAAAVIFQRAQTSDKDFLKIIEKFIENNKLYLIVKSFSYIEDQAINNMIFTQLQNHKELLKEYLQKCPSAMLANPFVTAKIKSLGFNDILIDTFLYLGKTTEALKTALDVKSLKCFEILQKFPETFSLFLEIPSFLSKLFALDCAKAGDFCEGKMEISRVVEYLPGDLLVKFLMDYEKVTASLEKKLFEVLLKSFPEKIIEFASKIQYLEYEYMLAAVDSLQLDDVKVFLLRKLNSQEAALEILHSNFEVRLKYIKYYPELWEKTVQEADGSIENTKKVLGCIHYYENSIKFITSLDFKFYEFEIKEFIRKQGKILDIYKNSVNADKKEQFFQFCLLFEEYRKGVVFSPPFVCCKCAQPLSTIRLRKCGHHSHKECFNDCIFCIHPSYLTKF